jgi:hypothetical protein
VRGALVGFCGLATESKTRIKTNFIADEPYPDVGTYGPTSEALRTPSAPCPRPFLACLIDSAELTDRQWYRNRKPAVALKACPLDCSAQSLVNPLACWIDTIW